MKKIFIYTIFFVCILIGCNNFKPLKTNNNSTQGYNDTMKIDILCLMLTYPEYIVDVEKNSNEEVFLVLKSGKKIIYDDKKQKNYNQKLENPDIEDILNEKYPLNIIEKIPDENIEPGRFRNYFLLKEVYGNSRKNVELNLTNVFGFQFNKNNNASKSLKSIFEEINSSINSKIKYSYIYPISGTYNYRNISGTNRLSAHSFGIAIDLKYHKHDYWKWANKVQGNNRLKDYPKEVVKIFEKNGFIWGGKWNHFDILHFEYRPEILAKSNYYTSNSFEEWYDSFGQTEYANQFLKKIKDKL